MLGSRDCTQRRIAAARAALVHRLLSRITIALIVGKRLADHTPSSVRWKHRRNSSSRRNAPSVRTSSGLKFSDQRPNRSAAGRCIVAPSNRLVMRRTMKPPVVTTSRSQIAASTSLNAASMQVFSVQTKFLAGTISSLILGCACARPAQRASSNHQIFFISLVATAPKP